MDLSGARLRGDGVEQLVLGGWINAVRRGQARGHLTLAARGFVPPRGVPLRIEADGVTLDVSVLEHARDENAGGRRFRFVADCDEAELAARLVPNPAATTAGTMYGKDEARPVRAGGLLQAARDLIKR